MENLGRRAFLRQAGLGIAAGTLVLRPGVEPTASSGELGDFAVAAGDMPAPSEKLAAAWQPTADNILGPFYRPGAPYRGKITPPLLAGKTLLIQGRVWGHDTRRPLAGAVLDIWQANAEGRYDNDDPRKPPAKNVFLNRARLLTDETGYYEYETIHPGAYQIGPEQWRPAHIHYLVRHAGYAQLVTQLYFRGESRNATDQFIKESLIVDLETTKGDQGEYERGVFDIVLAKK